MRYQSENAIVIGDVVELNVVEFNDKPVLEAHFVQYDSELRKHDLNADGIIESDLWACQAFDDQCINGFHSFRSVRIFHLAPEENIKITCGDTVKARITSSYIGDKPAKDKIPRRKIHITVSHVQREYYWKRSILSDPPCMVITLVCGTRKIREKTIPFTIKWGIRVDNGRAHPVRAEIFPNGSILRVFPDSSRETMTTGDYRLAQRQRGRTMQDIDKDFLRIPSYDRMVPTRERRWCAHYGVHV